MIAGVGGGVPSIVKFPHVEELHSAEIERGAASNAAPQSPNGPSQTSTGQRIQPASESEKSKNQDPEDLSEEEQRQVDDLRRRDAEVRAHEQAHAARGGAYTSAPSYEYTVGPDGKRYATSGEVKIDTSPVRDNPEATVRKMDAVIAAALAPADPSSQDLQVARQAQEQRAKAQIEATKKRDAEHAEKNGEETEDGATGQTNGPAQPDPSASKLLQANAAYSRANEENGPSRANEVFSLSQQFSIFA